MSKEKGNKKDKLIIKRTEYFEGIYSIIKVLIGIFMGFISGFLKFAAIVGVLLWVLSILLIYIVFRNTFNLENVHPAKMLLLNGTFSSFIAFVLTWGLLLGPP